MPLDASTLLHSAAQLLFLCVHGAIIVCVIQQIRKKNPTLRSTFFVIYLMESAVDVVYIIWMNLFLGMLRMGLLVDLYSIFPIGNASFFVIAYGEGFQMVAHAAIAVNRYAVMSRHAVTVHLPLTYSPA
ncbi:hypothetical protein AAVH_18755 [Aphelenchoides avenae]|nr:hypothetical protein AAVH_18755 [Aphelenchus avenae]